MFVEDDKGPKHSSHVEDDVSQKGAGGHFERFDQSNASCYYSGDKDSRS